MASNERMQALIEKYVSSLPERMETIQSSCQTLRQAHEAGQWDDTAARGVLYGVHKLAGSAGSMGFYPLGHAAGAIEAMLTVLIERNRLMSPLDLSQLLMLLAGLAKRIEAVRVEDSTLGHEEDTLWGTPPLSDASGLKVLLVGLEAEPALAQSLVPFGLELDPLALSDLPQRGAKGAVAVLITQSQAAQIVPLWNSTEGRDFTSLPLLVVGDDLSLSARVAVAQLALEKARLLGETVGLDSAQGALLVSPPLSPALLVDAINQHNGRKSSAPMRVLMVDDDRAILALCEHLCVSAGIDFRGIESPETILDDLATYRPDVLVLDRCFPDWDGFDIAMAMRQHGGYPSVPVVFMTSESSLQSRQDALVAGGDAFLPKPIEPAMFLSLLRARVARARKMKASLATDPLTGLVNHAAFIAELDRLLASARRARRGASLLLLDLDHFKSINDHWGHLVGDGVLRNVSRLLQRRLRASDVIGRVGGGRVRRLPSRHSARIGGSGGRDSAGVICRLATNHQRRERVPCHLLCGRGGLERRRRRRLASPRRSRADDGQDQWAELPAHRRRQAPAVSLTPPPPLRPEPNITCLAQALPLTTPLSLER